jgi:hypothetical protein
MFQISNRPLKLYIDKQNDISTITSNQQQDSNTRFIYFGTGIFIIFFSIIYFKISSNLKVNNNESSILKIVKSFFNGLLGSCAILSMPICWVINFSIGLQYFYIYPIFLLVIRFFRYVGSLILYFMNRNSTAKSSFSDDLIKTFENFKDYTPSWGLFGVEELKTILGMFGYDNLFSKSIISEDNSSYDISNNKFVSSGLLYFFYQQNYGGMITSVIIMFLTIAISMIILFGVLQINKIT